MSQSYEFNKRMEQLHVDDIQFDKQGNTIYDELEQKERSSDHWQDLEKKYGINFGDVVKIDDHLGRVQELHVSEESKDSNGLTKIEHFGEYVSEEAKDSNGRTGDRVSMRLWGGTELEDFDCSELGMSAKEFLKDIKIQPHNV